MDSSGGVYQNCIIVFEAFVCGHLHGRSGQDRAGYHGGTECGFFVIAFRPRSLSFSILFMISIERNLVKCGDLF
jgi:hypothetical protein